MDTKNKITIFKSPEDKNLVMIYEHFLELSKSSKTKAYNMDNDYYPTLDDLKKNPTKAWYDKMNKLIDAYGYENYRNHVKHILEHMVIVQKSWNFIERQKIKDRKLRIYKARLDYVDESELNNYSDWGELTEYYFFCSVIARYIRGIIFSVTSIPDPLLLNLLKDFALVYPFQSPNVSQAPTGLFTYDIMEVFSKLEVNRAIGYIIALRNSIKAKYFQQKSEGVIRRLAKENNITEQEIVEMGISDFGLDENGVVIMPIGNYLLNYKHLEFGEEETWWTNQATQKIQKSIPNEVKENHAEKYKYLKKHLNDLQSDLMHHAKRVESYYLEDKIWSYDKWNVNYRQHRLVRILSKTLVWMFEIKGKFHQGIITQGEIVLSNGMDFIETECGQVKLWHPITEALQFDIARFKQLQNQCFKQIDRETYTCGFIENQFGKRLNKSILSQIYKARGWTFPSPTIKRKIVSHELEVLVELTDVADGTIGQFSGSNTCQIIGVEFKKNGSIIECESVNRTIYSELARDIDLFVQKAGLK